VPHDSQPTASIRSSVARVTLVAALGSGCIAYPVTYRPICSGEVVDTMARPVPGARVRACSSTRWAGLREGCLLSAWTLTGPDGRFSFDRATQWEITTPIPHEAPLPFTLLVACAPGGLTGGAKVVPSAPAVGLRIVVDAPDRMTVTSAGPGWTGPADVREAARQLCDAY
jgi:hypothetical protein